MTGTLHKCLQFTPTSVSQISGTLALHGEVWPVSTTLALLQDSPTDLPVNLWDVLVHLAGLARAIRTREWADAAHSLHSLLTQLGYAHTDTQRSAVMAAITASALTDDGLAALARLPALLVVHDRK